MSNASNRNQPRVQTKTLVSLLIEGERSFRNVELINISVGGALLLLPEPIAAGTRVKIELPIDHSSSFITCTGLVVWNSGPEATGTAVELGIRFIEIPLSTIRRLADFVRRELGQGT